FSVSFSDVLLKNKEILGVEMKKTVGAWIQAFTNFGNTLLSERSIVNIGEFLVKHPQANKLNDSEKRTLSDILKLFIWLINPIIDEDEVLNYKEHKRTEEVHALEEALNVSLFTSAQESLVPSSNT